MYEIVFPILLYPIIFLAGCEAMFWTEGVQEKNIEQIFVVGDSPIAAFVVDVLRQDKRLRVRSGIQSAASSADTIIRCDEKGQANRSNAHADSHTITIQTHGELFPISRVADRIESDVGAARGAALKLALKKHGQDQSLLETFPIEHQSIKPRLLGVHRSHGFRPAIEMLQRLVMIMLMSFICLTGMLASICVLVEERESKSIFTTLLVPVGRVKIMLAKFLAVNMLILHSLILHGLSFCTVVLLLFLMFLHSIGMHPVEYLLHASIPQLYKMAIDVAPSVIGVFLRMRAEIPPPSITGILFFLYVGVASSIIISSVYLFTASLAKTNKEAQMILTAPALTMIFLPCIALLPGIELNMGTAFIPLANLIIMQKFSNPPLLPALITLLEPIVIAAVLLPLAAASFFGRSTNTLKFQRRSRTPA